MASRIARMHRPVVRRIGRDLAAASTPDQMRAVIDRANRLTAPCRGVTIDATTFGGLNGLRVVPKRDRDSGRHMLMFHGGGYVFGSPTMYQALAGRIAKAAGATVHLPDYRLAPEHPHPAAIDDGLAAYRSMLARVPADRLVVGGDSAGGNLTIAVVQAARDDGLPMPAGAVLLSPWLDLRGAADDKFNAASEILILPAAVDRASSWYRGDHGADEPGVSPLVGSLDGLPPTLVQVSDSEILYTDSQDFAAAARAAGVDVRLEVEDDLWHVWQLMAPTVGEARRSIASIGRFIVERTT
jgi:monoterpene epsilon-lactone hydrolase